MNSFEAQTVEIQELLIARERRYWDLMAYRRRSISAIKDCMERLEALRKHLEPGVADQLVKEYAWLLRFLESIGPNALPEREDLRLCMQLARDLEERLARLTKGAGRTVHVHPKGYFGADP